LGNLEVSAIKTSENGIYRLQYKILKDTQKTFYWFTKYGVESNKVEFRTLNSVPNNTWNPFLNNNNPENISIAKAEITIIYLSLAKAKELYRITAASIPNTNLNDSNVLISIEKL